MFKELVLDLQAAQIINNFLFLLLLVKKLLLEREINEIAQTGSRTCKLMRINEN